MKSSGKGRVVIVLLSICILLFALYLSVDHRERVETPKVSYENEIPLPRPTDHYRWIAPTSLTVVSYFSLDCPHCRELFIKETEFEAVYRDAFSLIYRHSPLPQVQPYSYEKSVIAECVREQLGDESFFTMMEKIFAEYKPREPNGWVYDLAYDMGVDKTKFDVCIKESGDQIVHDALEEALAYGVYGTPTVAVFDGEELLYRLDKPNAATVIKLYNLLRTSYGNDNI